MLTFKESNLSRFFLRSSSSYRSDSVRQSRSVRDWFLGYVKSQHPTDEVCKTVKTIPTPAYTIKSFPKRPLEIMSDTDRHLVISITAFHWAPVPVTA
jgi:hypothetical protein